MHSLLQRQHLQGANQGRRPVQSPIPQCMCAFKLGSSCNLTCCTPTGRLHILQRCSLSCSLLTREGVHTWWSVMSRWGGGVTMHWNIWMPPIITFQKQRQHFQMLCDIGGGAGVVGRLGSYDIAIWGKSNRVLYNLLKLGEGLIKLRCVHVKAARRRANSKCLFVDLFLHCLIFYEGDTSPGAQHVCCPRSESICLRNCATKQRTNRSLSTLNSCLATRQALSNIIHSLEVISAPCKTFDQSLGPHLEDAQFEFFWWDSSNLLVDTIFQGFNGGENMTTQLLLQTGMKPKIIWSQIWQVWWVWHKLNMMLAQESLGSLGGMHGRIVHVQEHSGSAALEGLQKPPKDGNEQVCSHCMPGVLVIQ